MSELAGRILHSKSGFTRVVDKMEQAGLSAACAPNTTGARSHVLTDKGTTTMQRARRYHRDGIERHFSQRLTDNEIKVLTRASRRSVHTSARPPRPHPRLTPAPSQQGDRDRN